MAHSPRTVTSDGQVGPPVTRLKPPEPSFTGGTENLAGSVPRRFQVYRPNPPEGYREAGAANAPEEVQFEGVVFSDGTCAVRWLTANGSHSVWNSLSDLEKIHGHPEYGTRWEWLD